MHREMKRSPQTLPFKTSAQTTCTCKLGTRLTWAWVWQHEAILHGQRLCFTVVSWSLAWRSEQLMSKRGGQKRLNETFYSNHSPESCTQSAAGSACPH